MDGAALEADQGEDHHSKAARQATGQCVADSGVQGGVDAVRRLQENVHPTLVERRSAGSAEGEPQNDVLVLGAADTQAQGAHEDAEREGTQ